MDASRLILKLKFWFHLFSSVLSFLSFQHISFFLFSIPKLKIKRVKPFISVWLCQHRFVLYCSYLIFFFFLNFMMLVKYFKKIDSASRKLAKNYQTAVDTKNINCFFFRYNLRYQRILRKSKRICYSLGYLFLIKSLKLQIFSKESYFRFRYSFLFQIS